MPQILQLVLIHLVLVKVNIVIKQVIVLQMEYAQYYFIDNNKQPTKIVTYLIQILSHLIKKVIIWFLLK